MRFKKHIVIEKLYKLVFLLEDGESDGLEWGRLIDLLDIAVKEFKLKEQAYKLAQQEEVKEF